MTKRIPIFVLLLVLVFPLSAQIGEKSLNRRYQNEIRDSLTQVMLERQRGMQREAEGILATLPNEEKLYDESYISVVAELIDTVYADGSLHLDLLYRLSYNCRHLEGWTDDYPLGAFDVDSSNSCRAARATCGHQSSTSLLAVSAWHTQITLPSFGPAV